MQHDPEGVAQMTASIIANTSPAVTQRIVMLSDYVTGGGKTVPFGPELSREQIAAADGLDRTALALADGLDTLDITDGLKARMGYDDKTEVKQDLRNSVDAAHAAVEIRDIVTGGDPDRPVEIDASGISLRGLIGGAHAFHSAE